MKRSRMKSKRDPKLAAWSKAVRERDGNQCKFPDLCMSGDDRVDPHHIAPRGRRVDLKYDVDNGICLCRTHHDWVHAHPFEAEELGLLSTESYELAAKEAV